MKKDLEEKYRMQHAVQIISKNGTQEVGIWMMIQWSIFRPQLFVCQLKQNTYKSLSFIFIGCISFFSAKHTGQGYGITDPWKAVLWPLHIFCHPQKGAPCAGEQQWWWYLDRTLAHQRLLWGWWQQGIPSNVERAAVCVLYATAGQSWIHCRVSVCQCSIDAGTQCLNLMHSWVSESVQCAPWPGDVPWWGPTSAMSTAKKWFQK